MIDDADLRFYWDPVCPFAWMTSKWLRIVQSQRDLDIDWRFISLRILNKNVDYAADFPEGYLAGHTGGLHLLRVAASVRAAEGRQAMEVLYPAMSSMIFDEDPAVLADAFGGGSLASVERAETMLERAGFAMSHASAVDDESFDAVIAAETEEALAATGRDVGTPIIHYGPPDGPAFFGPVISRLPSDDDALELFDLVTGLVRFSGFAEIKRSLRELPQLVGLGGDPDAVGTVEDWHGGSRKLKR